MSQDAQRLVATLLSIKELQAECKSATHGVRKNLDECTSVLFSEVQSMGGRVRMKDGGMLHVNNRSHAKRISGDDVKNCILAPQLTHESDEDGSEEEDDKCSSHSGVTVLRGKRKRAASKEEGPLDKLCARVAKNVEQRMFPVTHFLDYSKPSKRARPDTVESTEWIEEAHTQREQMKGQLSSVRKDYATKIQPLKKTAVEMTTNTIDYVKELGGRLSYTLVHPTTHEQKYTTLVYRSSNTQGRLPTKRELKNICYDAVIAAVTEGRKKTDPDTAWQSNVVKNKAIDRIIDDIETIRKSSIVSAERVTLRGAK